MIASQADIGLRYRCLIIFVQLEKVKNEAQVAESHKDMKLDLIISMRDIKINSNLDSLTKLRDSSNSTMIIDILQKEHLMKIIPI